MKPVLRTPLIFDGHNDILSLLYKSGFAQVDLLILMFLQVICRAILILIRCAKVVLGWFFCYLGAIAHRSG